MTIQANTLSDQQISHDLGQLKSIAAAHMGSGAALETETVTIDGQELSVFAHAPKNLGELYKLGLEFGDQTFLVYQQERFNFAESLDLALRMARILKEKYEIQRGDRVAICARNSPEWCMAYMAITLVGAIVVPMNSWWKSSELKYGLSDSDSKLIFLDPARLDLVKPFIDKLDVQIVMIKPEVESTLPEFYELARSVKPLSQDELTQIEVFPEDKASIMYTSGSTGMPKGVLSMRSLKDSMKHGHIPPRALSVSRRAPSIRRRTMLVREYSLVGQLFLQRNIWLNELVWCQPSHYCLLPRRKWKIQPII